jgi:dimethylargininase
MFTYAIVRKPAESIINGITTAKLGVPDYGKTLRQHHAYVEALRACGLTIITLPAAETFPDSCFVEDTALLTKRCAIIARPGAPTRQGEEAAVLELLPRYFDHIESIEAPGTIEPGDIMMVGDHFYVGLSKRTNAAGARQMISLLETHGLSGSTVETRGMLHLKTGLSYLENDILMACGEILHEPEFAKFKLIAIDADEAYAANSIWVNDTVLVPAGFPKTRKKVEAAGYPVIPVDVSEFQKLDGGLSCLSLRF